MKYRSYNRELYKCTAQIFDTFNNIVIDRRDKNGTIQKLISVPCVNGNRSRVLKSLENNNKTLKLPLIAISMMSVQRDPVRVAGVNDGEYFQSNPTYDPIKIRPQPINIEYEMNIIVKYLEDIDEIFCNFVPFTNPDYYVVWPNPKNPSKNIKSQIVWDGNLSYMWADEIDETTPYEIIATTTFTYKSYIFPGMEADDKTDQPIIKRINFNSNIIPLGEEGYGMDRWYDVPLNNTFDNFIEKITSGLIQSDDGRPNWDYLPISGGLSGYWSDISGIVTGTTIGDNISGDNAVFLISDQQDVLVINDVGYLSKGMGYVNYWDYYTSTVSGELSGYQGIPN